MNAVTYIAPAAQRLDDAQTVRTATLVPSKLIRERHTTNMTFRKTTTGLRAGFYWGGNGAFLSTVEVIPAGKGRYALVFSGEFRGVATGLRSLLAALTDYRRRAMIAHEDFRSFQARFA